MPAHRPHTPTLQLTNSCCLASSPPPTPPAPLLLAAGWIPTSIINWSLEAIPLNIQRVRAAVARLGPAVMAALPDCNRQQGEECPKRPPLDLLGRLPRGWEARGAAAAAAGHATAAAANGVAGAGGSSGGVAAEGWGGSSSWILGSGGLDGSYGSSSSFQESGQEEGGHEGGGEAVEWRDAQG